tara:strand:+ start:2214 stop:2813 length:600 start_codon:yes stop_codon:yes gene_type:complete
MKKGDMLFALYVYIVGIATAKGKGEPVSARVKLLSTGDVEVTTKARMISVAEVKKFLAGFLAKAQAGKAGAIGNCQGLPIGFTAKEYAALTPLNVCTWYVGFGKTEWYNTVLAKTLSRTFSAHKKATKQADTKPSTKKQRVTASKNTPAPKAGRINKKGPKSNGRLTQAQKVEVRAKFGPEWYNRSNANTIRDWARKVA